MGLELSELVDPRHTALVTQECQQAVIGKLSALPDLAAAAQGEVVANIAELVRVGREAGIPIIHCTAERRADGQGANTNARLFQYMAKAESQLTPGSPGAQLVPEIPVADSDLVLPRLHGLSP